MPYVSDAQRRWAHTAAGTKALGGEAKVKEWDAASKGKDLPEKSMNGDVASMVAAKMMKAKGGPAEVASQKKAMSKSKRVRFSKKKGKKKR